MSSYQPIENYGVIGDLNTVALVGLNGSIDYMCFPYFDSPSIFAALLDKDKGGSFSICPHMHNFNTKQLYLPDTNVLLTRFLSEEGVGEITDFMPVEDIYKGHILVRRVTCVRGEIGFTMQCKPRFNYARSKHQIKKIDQHVRFISEESNNITIELKSNIPIEIDGSDALARFDLKGGEHVDFILELSEKDAPNVSNTDDFVERNLYKTINFWKDWIDQSNYKGRYTDIVNRSALILKLMTSYKYGSMVAAPTFSLPEWLGGERNWDYRYIWIRDASFTIYTLISLGYTKEASKFIEWVEKRCQDIGNAGYLGLMYKLDGSVDLKEETLPHLEGYMGSGPVRIGNAAADQLQLDIYGELMDAIYLYNKYGEPISHDFWLALSRQIDWLCDNWNQPDEGIWEVRGGKQKFLYSRFMCWVALERIVRIGESRPFPYPKKWSETRDEIYDSIWKDFWSDEKKCFVQFIGSDSVDAATLLMPLIRFINSKDPKWISTLEAIEKELVSDSLVYRYRPDKAAPDGVKGKEGTFSMCTFWYVECLSRAGQLQKARLYFEKMLGYANHLGLFSEMLGFKGEHLGNFPQAFTHLGLISAALNLDKQLNDQRNQDLSTSI
jgi:GH15 family glucan-1,4-alpha-glucosidase